MTSPPNTTKAEQNDADDGSKAIRRVINVLRSPSPDPRRPTSEPIAMNRFLVLVLSMGFLSHAVGEDSSWLKAPDGFVWPDAAEAKLEDDKQLGFSELPKEIRDYLTGRYSPRTAPTHVYVRRVDLNGDGDLEWFIDRPEQGGTGGGAYDILIISKKNARCIGDLLGGFHLAKASKQGGWLRIECSSRAGGGHFTRYLIEYIGGHYQTVRNEDHDLIHNKVTVRK